jgi:hypothetical protein
VPAARLFGRLPALIPAGLHDLTHYAAGSLPKAPAKVAVPDLAWGMLGNGPDPSCTVAPQGVGDCGPVGLDHGFMLDAADTALKESFPDSDQVVDYYLQYTGGQDTGVVLSQYLAYVRAKRFYGHAVSAYAPVGVHDIPTLQFTVNAYNWAFTGITVTQGMMAATDAGQPWTLETLDSDELGGHCVIIAGYDSQYLYAVTWGMVQPIAYSAWHYLSDEAWVVMTGELASAGTDGHGIAVAALTADLDRLAV